MKGNCTEDLKNFRNFHRICIFETTATEARGLLSLKDIGEWRPNLPYSSGSHSPLAPCRPGVFEEVQQTPSQ